ncbi:hypothetical protein V1477_017874 [Vespula maculifrons]|uniref:Uncharacterized protein n=1 Tax=Vespula maculifrons TaxID=7453 RepID=A0ABD2B020_VESMC
MKVISLASIAQIIGYSDKSKNNINRVVISLHDFGYTSEKEYGIYISLRTVLKVFQADSKRL